MRMNFRTFVVNDPTDGTTAYYFSKVVPAIP
jgi:hypothetical protein